MSNIICGIYCRVSKDEQDPKHQEDTLKEYAKFKKYKIHRIYTDVVTGSKSTRPLLNELLFDARKGLFNVVLVWKLDRLGRSLKHLINIAEEWQKIGVDFVCTSQNIDTTTSHGKLVFHILGAVAEFERELISERTKMGLRRAKNVGKRGKDRKPRRKSGYLLRYARQKEGGGTFV